MATRKRNLISNGDFSVNGTSNWLSWQDRENFLLWDSWRIADQGPGQIDRVSKFWQPTTDAPTDAPTDTAADAEPAAQADAGPVISTDLADYAPGSRAFITIEGIDPGSTVRFEIDHVLDPGEDGTWGTLDDVTYQLGGDGHDPWYATDGGDRDLDGVVDGKILTSWKVNADDSLDERFLLTGHVVDAGADGVFGTADDTDTDVASNTFTDAGGDYSIDFSVGNPGQYDKKRPSEFTVFPSGRSNDPIPGATDGTATELLSPKELALGQIVPFEVEISTGNSATFTGTMTFSISWSTTTSNGADFGYDESLGLIAAFVDGLDSATTDSDSTVSDFTWFHDAANDEIIGTITVTNLDPNTSSVVELWVALDPVIAPGTKGNVASRLVGAEEVGTGSRISTGAQTVPLLKVTEFFTGSTDLSVLVSDKPGETDPTAGDDPEGTLLAGDQFTYTILARNNSTDTVANGVILTDVLDANVDFVSATVNGVAVSGVFDSSTHQVTIDIGFLERLNFANDTATVLITVKVKDGVAPGTTLSNTASITSITSEGNSADNSNTETTALASNVAPVAADDTGSTAEDTPLSVTALSGVLSNDSDPEGQTISVTQFTVGGVTRAAGTTATLAEGDLSINTDGSYSFIPAANFNGAVPVVTYTVADSIGDSSTATLNLTVTPVNDPPVAVDDSATTDEDTAVIVSVLGNDSDVDGDTLVIDSTTAPANGSIVVNADGTITYTPGADFNGTDSFTYTISDGNGGTATATATVTVAPVNDPPVAVDDSATTDEDTPVVLDVLANDSDVDGDTLTVASLGGFVGGTAALNPDGTVTFTPGGDFNGTGSFTYTISDGNGGTATATATVTVAPVNDPPVANDDSATTDEDTPVVLDVLANDSDVDGDTLTVASLAGFVGGSAALNPDSTVTFTPGGDFNGTGSFTYTISDGNGGTATATATVTVAPVNDPPVAVDDSANTSSDGTVDLVLTANDLDVDGDDLEIESIDTTGLLGTVTVLDGDTVRYDPNGAFDGLGQGDTAIETFTYTVRDGNGGTSTATVTVTVGGVNDAPVAVNDSIRTGQARAITFDVLANDSDPNGDSLAITANTNPLNGTLVFNGDGTLTYDPDDAFFGTDSFQYTISDGRGGTASATATLTVDRNFAPSIPEPVVFFALENQTRAANLQAIDPEGDPVTYSIVGGVDAALFTINATTGALDFITAPDFENPSDSNRDNRYQVQVGLQDPLHSVSQLVTVNVRDVPDTPNRAPVITTNASNDLSLPLLINRSGVILDLDAIDPDGDTLVFQLFGEDASKFVLNPITGELTLPTPLTDPRGSFDGDFIYELDVLVTDGNGGQTTIGIDYILFTAG